jgi:hypothetical protein
MGAWFVDHGGWISKEARKAAKIPFWSVIARFVLKKLISGEPGRPAFA